MFNGGAQSMKFLRWLCNILLFAFMTVMISAIQVIGYDLIASEDNFGLDKDSGSSIEVVTVLPNDEKVEFIDTFKFWGTDIATGVKTEPKYRVRNWGSGWWSKNMKWADIAVDSTVAVFKPIFVPIAQVNALKDYYLTETYTANDVFHRNGEDIVSDTDLYEMYVLFSNFTYGGDNISEEICASSGVAIKDFNYNDSDAEGKFFKFSDGNYYHGDTLIGDYSALEEYCADELNYMTWVKDNKVAYNIDWKLQKYNQKAYAKYYKKFIHSDFLKDSSRKIIREVRVIKSSVVVLYFIQFTSAILALVFVIKYPVSLLQVKYENGRKRRKAEKVEKEKE